MNSILFHYKVIVTFTKLKKGLLVTTLCAINTVCTTNSSNVLKIKMMSILLQKDYLAAQNYPAM